MSALSLRRHHRRALDHVLHRAHQGWAEPEACAAFRSILAAVRARTDLLAAAPTVVRGAPRFDQVDALIHLARWWREHRALLATWPGRRGHPLVIIDDLARHLLGLYPTPRFLARVWSGDQADDDDWRGWVIAHGRGAALRSLPLPIALTRAMARHFVASDDHLPVRVALRCAEVRGLGGSPGLAVAVALSRLERTFTDGPYWRAALAWIVRWEDEVPPDHLGPVLDYLDARRIVDREPELIVRGRSGECRHRNIQILVGIYSLQGQGGRDPRNRRIRTPGNRHRPRQVRPEDGQRQGVVSFRKGRQGGRLRSEVRGEHEGTAVRCQRLFPTPGNRQGTSGTSDAEPRNDCGHPKGSHRIRRRFTGTRLHQVPGPIQHGRVLSVHGGHGDVEEEHPGGESNLHRLPFAAGSEDLSGICVAPRGSPPHRCQIRVPPEPQSLQFHPQIRGLPLRQHQLHQCLQQHPPHPWLRSRR